jgi:hydrogenase maturation protease
MRIIGCGNRERCDDAAGVLVAEQLRQQGVAAEIHTGEALDLIDVWEAADDVVVIDAVATGAPAGTVKVWDTQQWTVPLASSASTHGFGLAEAIELARTLGRLPKRLRVYGIEGRRFDLGAEVSPEVQRAVAEVVRQLTVSADSWSVSPIAM